MTTDSNTPAKSFWQKSNDPENREWPYRLSRALRANVHKWCGKVMHLAEDPRALAAWKKGWDRTITSVCGAGMTKDFVRRSSSTSERMKVVGQR